LLPIIPTVATIRVPNGSPGADPSARVVGRTHEHACLTSGLAVQRGFEQGLFHRQIAQVEPLLQEVFAQHRAQLNSSGGRPVLAPGACGSIRATKAAHGITAFNSS